MCRFMQIIYLFVFSLLLLVQADDSSDALNQKPPQPHGSADSLQEIEQAMKELEMKRARLLAEREQQHVSSEPQSVVVDPLLRDHVEFHTTVAVGTGDDSASKRTNKLEETASSPPEPPPVTSHTPPRAKDDWDPLQSVNGELDDMSLAFHHHDEHELLSAIGSLSLRLPRALRNAMKAAASGGLS